ncbi:cytochrome P450 [Syncephalis fuscata]|nr:cytochrome P450 [Syncephalis fuscata]
MECKKKQCELIGASTDYYMKDSYNFVHQMELQTNSEVIRMLCTIANDTDIAASLKMIFPLKVYRWIFRHITAYKKNHKLSSEIFVPEIQRRRDMKTKLGDDYVSSYDMLEWITFTEDPNGRLYNVNIVANRVLEAAFVAVSTTSNNTLHLLFDMASYPDYRKKLQDEQNEIIHRYGNDITDESLRGMTFLDAFVRESLRVNGNAQAVRIALDDVQLKSGYVIPKGRFRHINKYHTNT